MPKIRCASKNNFHTLTHPSKGVQKNMLKAWNFSKNKICHRCFDNNLQKLFRTKILKNSNGKILLIVALMVGLWLMTNGDS